MPMYEGSGAVMTYKYRSIYSLACLCFLALFIDGAQAQNRVTFPADFDQMVMYGDYRRGSGGEQAYALQETIDIARAGQPLPPGTRLVLEIYNNNALTDYFVMEKGEGWGLDFSEEQRTSDWHFQQYDPDRQVRRTSIAERCQSCHQGAASNDFMFTIDRMRAYL
ncbi:hypothetical protein EOD00_38960, partial [Mesorhizobium sp. M7A.T.Ca.TU.009.01.3.1]